MAACTTKECEREARMAIRTLRPTRPGLESRVYYDDRGAPKTALPYCKPCGVALVTSMAEAMVADNEED